MTERQTRLAACLFWRRRGNRVRLASEQLRLVELRRASDEERDRHAIAAWRAGIGSDRYDNIAAE